MKRVLLVLIMSLSFYACDKQEGELYSPIPEHVKAMLGMDTKYQARVNEPAEPWCTGIDSNGWNYVVFEYQGNYYSGMWGSGSDYQQTLLGPSTVSADNACSVHGNGAWSGLAMSDQDILFKL